MFCLQSLTEVISIYNLISFQNYSLFSSVLYYYICFIIFSNIELILNVIFVNYIIYYVINTSNLTCTFSNSVLV